jgi:predicted O-methyltransferase YrrM
MSPLLRFAGRFVPEETKGMIEYHLRPYLCDKWGGPLNGQCRRLAIMTDLLAACSPTTILETGTFRGSSTLWFALNSKAAVRSVEAVPRNYGFAKRRLRGHANVQLHLGDSRSFLRSVPASNKPTLIYLDAHWAEDLPLKEEVEIALERFSECVIVVDDFEVPGDPGYGHDDYGAGKNLSLTDFPFHRDPRITLFLPTAPSSTESGKKRGCVVLAGARLAASVSTVPSLRPAILS